MKGKTQIFAVLAILFLLFLSPQHSTANPASKESAILLQNSNSLNNNFISYLHKERVLVDGIWWIFVYDSGKLIDAYPE